MMSCLSEITPGAEYRVARQATRTPKMEALFETVAQARDPEQRFLLFGREHLWVSFFEEETFEKASGRRHLGGDI